MTHSFFFYDLETSGLSPRSARIMQFAGQRTDMNLQPVGDPHNYLIKLTEDVLPEADAILLTRITPQQTIADGLTEVEFLRIFQREIATPDTIFLGYNTIRFDDEFMRFLQWRNFYDAYEWQWQDGRSRWDLLDLVRMVRALRPDGIRWPFASDGKPSNRLELLTSLNKLTHTAAHDALSDVQATIALAQLIKDHQPKLFSYLLELRDKKKVAALVDSNTPFVYTTSKYSSEFEKTSVAVKLADHPKRAAALVYDLRYDPTEFLALSAEEIVERWRWQKEPKSPRLPIKTLRFNVCPAIAPLSVLDKDSQERLHLDLAVVQTHLKKLRSKDFVAKVLHALEIMDTQQQTRLLEDEQDVDSRLYDGFLPDADRTLLRVVRSAEPSELQSPAPDFHDQRLGALLPLYIARNYPKVLTDENRQIWERFRERKLLVSGQFATFQKRLDELRARKDLTTEQQYVLEELRLYGESIIPAEPDE